MNIQQYHNEWLKKELHSNISQKDINQKISSRLRQSVFLRYLKGILGNRIKNIIKSLLEAKIIFGYPISLYEKEVAISYIKHIFANNPEIDDDVFEESMEEIKSIINNQFIFSYNNFADWKKIYPGHKLKEFNQAQTFHKKALRKCGDIYEYNGFKSTVPDFEYSVLVNNCGIGYIPNKVAENIKNTIIIDCGAFIGDSVFIFDKFFNPKKIIAIEADKNNVDILNKNIAINKIKNVNPICCGVGDVHGKVKIAQHGIWSHISESGDQEIEIITIDSLKEKMSDKIGLIKMDIEGYEMNALQGAKLTIKKDKPVLLISIYHSGRDFFEIPKYIKNINSSYKMKIVSSSPLSPIYEKHLIAY